MTEHAGERKDLTLVRGGGQGKGMPGRSLHGRLGLLRELPPRKRLTLILEDPDPSGLVAELEPQEYHLLLREIGLNDATALLPLATPEQLAFCLDRELWHRDEYLPEKGLTWLELLVTGEEADLVALLPHLDFGLILLILMHEITVGGGAGDLLTDDERQTEWDHSFDNIFMITYRHHQSSELVGRFLDIIYRSDKQLYQGLMEGIKNEVSPEVEEHCRRFRAGRLADHGFPDRLDALTIYTQVDPASFRPEKRGQKVLPAERDPILPSLFRHDDSLLGRTLRRADSAELLRELQYLITCALVVEEPESDDDERAEAVLLRVHGYLTIALEYLAGDDEARAAEILSGTCLKQLFQLGYTLVRRLRRQGLPLTSDDHATGSVLAGLQADFPRFYRGLDRAGVDGYREFSDLEDVRTVEQFLTLLAG